MVTKSMFIGRISHASSLVQLVPAAMFPYMPMFFSLFVKGDKLDLISKIYAIERLTLNIEKCDVVCGRIDVVNSPYYANTI